MCILSIITPWLETVFGGFFVFFNESTNQNQLHFIYTSLTVGFADIQSVQTIQIFTKNLYIQIYTDFEEVLNRPALAEQPHISVAKIPLQIMCGRPTKAEIKAAINQQKSGKAIYPHNISLEALKVDSNLSTDMVYSFFGRIWEEEKTPTEWATLWNHPRKVT